MGREMVLVELAPLRRMFSRHSFPFGVVTHLPSVMGLHTLPALRRLVGIMSRLRDQGHASYLQCWANLATSHVINERRALMAI